MADEDATLDAIYRLAGQPYTEDVRAAMAAFSATHPRGRHGGINYDPAAIGIDPDEVGQRLNDYRNRFVGADRPQQVPSRPAG